MYFFPKQLTTALAAQSADVREVCLDEPGGWGMEVGWLLDSQSPVGWLAAIGVQFDKEPEKNKVIRIHIVAQFTVGSFPFRNKHSENYPLPMILEIGMKRPL